MLSWFAALLSFGSPAPDFTLSDDSGGRVKLSEWLAKGPVVLVFYPMDETPGCTTQLCEIRDHWSEFQKRGVAVFGVNPGSAESHTKFRKNRSLPLALLVDEGKQVAALYGANGIVPRRTVYGIGRDGRIAFAERGQPTPAKVLAALEGR